MSIFQFTPLREGRPSFTRTNGLETFDFNSRPSARGDLKDVMPGLSQYVISIHAPPRGATLTIDDISTASIFQFTPLREGRRAKRLKNSRRFTFQFTPLREGRPSASLGEISGNRFQFTPLREGRRAQRWNRLVEMKFQFTPLREGRPRWSASPRKKKSISIHAPPRGATGAGATATYQRDVFQFTPLREGRRRGAPSYTVMC